jgi:hypothetical protein
LKFGLLTYRDSQNLGDEIQSIAAQQFLPRVDVTIDREELSSFPAGDPASVILNGWFMHHPEAWPPSPGIRPLLTSMHITLEASADLMSGEKAEYFRRWGPVGGRDWHTVELFESHGIPAFWSGCLTLTLEAERPAPAREDVVYAVELGDGAFQHLATRCRSPLARVSHLFPPASAAVRFDRARDLLARYARAKAVVTNRLHCALPCLALGTPVLFIESALDRYRFSGLRDLMHHVDRHCFLADRHDFDFASPPANPTYHQTLRRTLGDSVRRFIAAA